MSNEAPPARRRVLVVDDEVAILPFVSASLELSGYEPTATTRPRRKAKESVTGRLPSGDG